MQLVTLLCAFLFVINTSSSDKINIAVNKNLRSRPSREYEFLARDTGIYNSQYLDPDCEGKMSSTILFINNSLHTLSISVSLLSPTGKELFINEIRVDRKSINPLSGLREGVYTYEVSAFDYNGKTVRTGKNFMYSSGRINLVKCRVNETVIQ